MNPLLKQLRFLMNTQNLDAILITSLPNIIYLTNFNHFYAEDREAFLLITKKNAYILTDKRYTLAVKKYITNFTLLEIAYGKGFSDWIKEIAQNEKITKLGVEENHLTYSEYKKIAPYIQTLNNFSLTSLRVKKSKKELLAIQKACEIGDIVFEKILGELRVGISEQEVMSLMEIEMKKHGAKSAFDAIIAFGENSAYIHHKTGNKKLEKNMPILLDFGVKYDNYCSDMSRTIFFGNATVEQKKAYKTVLAAQEKANEYIQKLLTKDETIHGAKVDKIARDYIVTHGYDSFPHALGHGIGLEVHEEPTMRPPSTSTLEKGMVFTNEPGIYIAEKFGIRIEDVYAIRDKTLVQLTKSSRELLEI